MATMREKTTYEVWVRDERGVMSQLPTLHTTPERAQKFADQFNESAREEVRETKERVKRTALVVVSRTTKTYLDPLQNMVALLMRETPYLQAREFLPDLMPTAVERQGRGKGNTVLLHMDRGLAQQLIQQLHSTVLGLPQSTHHWVVQALREAQWTLERKVNSEPPSSGEGDSEGIAV